MTTTALRNQIIKKLNSIEDKEKLVSIQNYIETENSTIILTPDLENLLAISEQQYQNGQYKSHEKVMEELDLWIQEKR